jgi:membrane protein implicated in regulation of membrane protease activity
MPYWFWLVCGTALLIIEIIVPHYVTIWFGLAALFTGVIAYWFGGIAVQLTVFSVTTIVLFLLGWFWLRKNMRMSTRVRHSKEVVIGETGVVITPNVGTQQNGKVRFQVPIHGDDVWEFISDDFLAHGDRCYVIEIAGAKVKVKKL